MKRKSTLIVLLFSLLIIGIIFVQYRVYRGSSNISSQEMTTNRSLQTTGETKHIIPLDQLVSGGIVRDGIPPIDEPKFESVPVADQYLNNDGYGIAIEQSGSVKFYPEQLLVWHHIVNDMASHVPILVSYNPLTAAGSVFLRTVNGSVLDFGVSDRIYNNNLLLYDRATNSLWDPLLHVSVVGELAGTSLTFYPFSIMTWSDFKSEHPNGGVLSRKTGATRDYTHDPYEQYYSDHRILFPVSSIDDRLPSKELIIGLETTEGWKAYPMKAFEKEFVITDVIGTLSVSLEKEETSSIIRAYLTNSNSSVKKEIPFIKSYWFAWAAAYPQTDLYFQK